MGFRLKPKSDGKEGWPVIDGQPTEPYELPDSPATNEALLEQIAAFGERRREQERTAPARALRNIVRARQETRGIITFQRVLFRGRAYIEVRRHLDGGRQYRVYLGSERTVATLELRRKHGRDAAQS